MCAGEALILPCLSEAYLSHPAHPELPSQLVPGRYVEPLNDTRARVAVAFRILLGSPGMLSQQ